MRDLAKRFDIPGVVDISPGKGGLTRVAVMSDLCQAEIYLLGAMVTNYKPAGRKPVLWLSDESKFEIGGDTDIYGGVPICYPWFGNPKDDPQAKIHGFVRDFEWDIESVTQDSDGRVVLKFVFPQNLPIEDQWRGKFNTTMEITAGSELTMMLHTENISSEPIGITEALHTYYSVSDVRDVKLLGLGGVEYLDKCRDFARTVQQGDKTFTGHTDSVYVNTRATCVLEDPAWNRKIIISKSGSDTTVVWNPWDKGAAWIEGFGDNDWPGMVCVETANAADNAITINPGKSHSLQVTISVENL